MLTHTQYAVEDINAKGGVLKGTKLQLLQFDSKPRRRRARALLPGRHRPGRARHRHRRFGPSVVTALVQAAARHNQRQPGQGDPGAQPPPSTPS